MSNQRIGRPKLGIQLLLIGVLARNAIAEPAAARVPIDEDPDLTTVSEPPGIIADFDVFITQLLHGNADVTVAQQEIERTRGVARQALAALLPTLNASETLQYTQPTGGYATSPSGTVGSSSTTSASTVVLSSAPIVATSTLSLSQSLISPRALYAIGTNDRSIESARATAADRVRTTLGTAADDLLAEVSAARTAEVSRVGLRSALEVMTMTARKLELGSATKLDLVRTTQDVESARATVVSAQEALRKAREALGLVMGADTALGVSTTLRSEMIETALQSRCQPSAIERRADVAAATLEAEIARRTLRDSMLAYLPSLSLSSTASVSTVTQLSGENWSFSLLGNLSVPIWDGGTREGASRSARAALAVKHAQLGAITRAAMVQKVQTARGVTVAEAAQTVALRSRALAEETARLTRSAFASGTGTSFDVVDAARKAREAELNLIGKNYELVRARVEALLATATCSL